MLEQFIIGFQLMLTWQNIFFAVLGIAVGIFIGAIPGLTVTMAIALMIPMTFKMDPIPAIAMLLGVYKGGVYGGSISAILINTPGTPAASATVLDGYPMSQKGQAFKGLKMALYASVISDTSSDIILILVAPPLAMFALRFGPPEIFALVLFSLTIIAYVSGESMLKGLVVATLGLLFGTVGIDPIDGLSRFSFGYVEILNGIALVPMLIGLFAISEVLAKVEIKVQEYLHQMGTKYSDHPNDNNLTWRELRACLRTIFRGVGIGTFLGAIPGIGPAPAAFLNYGMARRASKHFERFGEGELEGVAAAESANSATCGATLIPLLCLGIPGDIMTAVLMGAFMIQGITPGPMMFQERANIIYALFVGLMVCNLANLIIGRLSIKTAKNVIRIPGPILYAVIILFCFVGSYAVNNSFFDVQVMFFFGFLGYLMRKYGFPLPPLLIAFILGPMMENALRQSLIIFDGDITNFLTRPIVLFFLVVTAMTVTFNVHKALRKSKNKNGVM
jgi:putative tricarboxylic transport membrane protein